MKVDKDAVHDLSLYEASGYSMWPFLRPGSKLIIRKTPLSKSNLKVGDIILYRKDNQLVCHRLVRMVRNNGRFLLYARGDNSTSSPEFVPEEIFFD